MTCATHHHACACREAEFTKIKEERDNAYECLGRIAKQVFPGEMDSAEAVMQMVRERDRAAREIEALKAALGWKKIDRKEYPKNYEIMKHSQGFMEEYVSMLQDEIGSLKAEIAEWVSRKDEFLSEHDENVRLHTEVEKMKAERDRYREALERISAPTACLEKIARHCDDCYTDTLDAREALSAPPAPSKREEPREEHGKHRCTGDSCPTCIQMDAEEGK